MRTTTQAIICTEPGGCGASITLAVCGSHDLHSTGQVLDDVATAAGWDVPGARCPDHRRRPDPKRHRLTLEDRE
jgi:hypothetical protein